MSILLTAQHGAAAQAELVGHAQVVDTGEAVAIRSLLELGQLLQRLAALESDSGGTP